MYPEARVVVDEKAGLTLYPSPPPISERKKQPSGEVGLYLRAPAQTEGTMPINRELRWFYPIDWPEISRRVRFERAGGVCEGCGRPHGADCPLPARRPLV